MPRRAVRIQLSSDERKELNKIINSHKSPQDRVFRAKIIIGNADGKRNKDIAAELGTRENTVSKWVKRFEQQRMDGISDEKRSGRPCTYDYEGDFGKAILDKLKEEPPAGISCWDGSVLAKELGFPPARVWQFLRKKNIQLKRHRSWCISTDPEFEAKSADVIGLYLAPPSDAVVLCVDEKPSIQALSRKTGYVKTENSKIVQAHKSTYRRNGTLNLFAALNVATGYIHGKTTATKTRMDFQSFLDDLVAEIEESEENRNKEYHIIMDNYCTHKRNDEWLEKHPNVHFHYTPTSASWLNMVEIWFNIFSRKVLKGASHDSTEQLADAIKKFIEYYNEDCEPFVWRKRTVRGSQIQDNIANLCN